MQIGPRLEAFCLIYRKPGVGTFVRRQSLISNPLNKFIDFFALIRENGYTPSFQQIETTLAQPREDVASRLQLTAGERVLEVQKLFYADNEPIIYCINLIPEWVYTPVYTPEQAVQPGLTEPFFPFFEEQCGRRIEYYISSVRADRLKDCTLPPVFAVFDPGLPTLVIDEVGYDAAERPVHQSIEYHPGNRMNFKLIRSR